MHNKVKEFILENENLINDNVWDELYKKAEKELDVLTGLLTDALYEAELYPLEYLDYIPEAFGFGSHRKEFDIPVGVKLVCQDAFGDCKLERISLPDTLEKIEDEGFAFCAELKTIKIPDGVTKIGSCAFDCCKKLTSVNIPSHLRVLHEATFNLCASLSHVDTTRADSLERIESRAFQGCVNLDELYIPPSVTYIANKSIPEHTDILCKENSYAHEYAIAKDRHYKLV